MFFSFETFIDKIMMTVLAYTISNLKEKPHLTIS